MTSKVIDYTAPIQAIKEKYGEHYFRDADAINEAAALWGFECNEHGVVKDTEHIMLYHKDMYRAEVWLAKSKLELYLVGARAETPISGMGFLPSVWHRIGYTQRAAARSAGAEFVLEHFRREQHNSAKLGLTVRNRRLNQVLHVLEDRSEPTLFD